MGPLRRHQPARGRDGSRASPGNRLAAIDEAHDRFERHFEFETRRARPITACLHRRILRHGGIDRIDKFSSVPVHSFVHSCSPIWPPAWSGPLTLSG